MRDIPALLRSRFPELNEVGVEASDSQVWIGGSDSLTNVAVVHENDEWTVYTNEAHEHYDNRDDALFAAALLATGKARVCVEYRNGTEAGSWFEYEDNEDEFTMGSAALYLPPFDRDEWEVFEGDVWKQVRTDRRQGPAGTLRLESFELVVDQPMHTDNAMLDWLNNGLAEPMPGMKWATTFDAVVVLQVPAGWRIVSDRKSADTEWAPTGGGMLLRLSRFSKDADSQHKVRTISAAKPLSVEHESLSNAPEWIHDRWTLLFGNEDRDFMLWVSLYSRVGEEAFHGLTRDQVASDIDKTVFVPPTSEWDTRTVD